MMPSTGNKPPTRHGRKYLYSLKNAECPNTLGNRFAGLASVPPISGPKEAPVVQASGRKEKARASFVESVSSDMLDFRMPMLPLSEPALRVWRLQGVSAWMLRDLVAL